MSNSPEVICITNSCLSFASNTFNTSPTGTFCVNANTPAGCNQQPELYGKCDPKVKAYTQYFACFSLLVSTYSIVVMLYSMIRLINSVLNKDRQYGDLPANPTQEQLQKYTLRKQLLKETMSQAIMYTVSWFVCQSATIVLVVLIYTGAPLEKLPTVLQICCFTFVPLNGAVNVFIYTRPAVRHVRRVDSSISRFRAFGMVLQAGGEAPNMEQSPSSINQQQNQQPQPDMSSREPFQCYYYDGNDLCLSLDHLNDVSSVDLKVIVSEELVEKVAVSTWSGPSNTNIALNIKIRCLESGPFAKDVNEYSHYDVDMLESSGRISDDNAADSTSQTSDRQSKEDFDERLGGT